MRETTAHSTQSHQDHADARGPVSWAMAATATLHCLTGCAIGEVLGMVIGTATGPHNAATVAVMELMDNAFIVAVP